MAADIVTLGDLPSTSTGLLTLIAEKEGISGTEHRKSFAIENPITNETNLEINAYSYTGTGNRPGASIVFPESGFLYVYGSSVSAQPTMVLDNYNRRVGIQTSPGVNRFSVAGNAAIGSFSWMNNSVPDGSIAIEKNIGMGTYSEFGSGETVFGMANATVAPSVTPSGGGVLYVESSGTVTTIANA